jgi:glycosyltransferase involved in cell wall biosynthesis
VGSGRDEMTLKKMAKDIKSIDFVGYHHPQKYYETASILCLTSLFEGFPMAITEGMQFGCVPIAFGSFPAIYDMIESGYNGEIIKPFNKKEYAKRLKFLMTNDEYRNELSRKAIETVKQYDTSNIVLQWEKLFNQICDNQ